MNNKLLLQDLTDQLSEAGKLKKKDAEEFLRTLFKVTEDALFQGEVVKISGLGSFKLLLVDARKSVNVSTGEVFEIKEHYKIAFAPDANLKESVNQPFSHLEPVELDAPDEKQTEPSVTSQQPPLTEHKAFKTSAGDKEKVNAENKPKISKAEDEAAPKNKTRATILWALFFVAIAALGIWAWISNEKAQKEYEQKIGEIERMDAADTKAAMKEDLASGDLTDTLANKDTVVDKKVSEVPSVIRKPIENAAKISTQPIRPVEKTVAAAPASTSGYTFPVTITMDAGSRLTLLALKYYGHKAFWVYIYQANKDVISNPDHVSAGTKIRIPKPNPLQINAKSATCIAKAKELQFKILGH
jgi:nucleoid DNA-binding protein